MPSRLLNLAAYASRTGTMQLTFALFWSPCILMNGTRRSSRTSCASAVCYQFLQSIMAKLAHINWHVGYAGILILRFFTKHLNHLQNATVKQVLPMSETVRLACVWSWFWCGILVVPQRKYRAMLCWIKIALAALPQKLCYPSLHLRLSSSPFL